ncbi:hypothetical protein LAZ67_12001720 [Cordylochernes scorpioides]|uniref:Reverse transcriptase n=1 Tax=Cordylochernes scorpioides TaxID=51811 RepID=A0ABY6L1A6_9ARAC|nr:hypothetical protein LAZ67_12001720 [Cordylochernes scorpioides]
MKAASEEKKYRPKKGPGVLTSLLVKWEDLDLNHKWKIIKRTRPSLCTSCLRQERHRSWQCLKKEICDIDRCEKIHHRSLHNYCAPQVENSSQETSNLSSTQQANPTSGSVNITVVNGEADLRFTGHRSEPNRISKGLADSVGLEGKSHHYSYDTASGETIMEPNAVVVNCELAGIFRGAPYLPMQNAVTGCVNYTVSEPVNDNDLRELIKSSFSTENFEVIPRTRWQGKNKVVGSAYDILQRTTKRTGAYWETAIHVKNENAMQHEQVNHELAHTIVNDFYVDDCLTGADSEENCMDLRRELSVVNAAGGFHLCKFNSNSRAVIESIPEELRAEGVKYLNEKSVLSAGNVLGMWWDPTKDIFGFKFGLNKVPPEILEGAVPTKRQACRFVIRVYDPLGLVNHLKIKGIIILQRTWIAGIGWDEDLTSDIYAAWKLWLNLLSRSIIRQVVVHTFVDVSQEAFSAVTYLRVETRNGNIGTTLFGSKARVAPLKKLNIQKLELQNCVRGTRFAVILCSELRLPKVDREVFWSDSKTVLAWIRSEARRYKAFVANKWLTESARSRKRQKESTGAKLWRDNTQRKSPRLHRPLTRLLNLEDISSHNRLVCRAAAVKKSARFWYKKTFHVWTVNPESGKQFPVFCTRS